jgi:hypothetical protein
MLQNLPLLQPEPHRLGTGRRIHLPDWPAIINATAGRGAAALILASTSGNLEVVQALLAKGADVNAKEPDGTTALTLARSAEVRAALVQAGAKP